MNYYDIGQRIRKIRKAKGFSQELLAEIVGISTTHMSHIETANTKLSLSVFVEIANALEVTTDDLLFDTPNDNISSASSEIMDILNRCSSREAKVITHIVKAAKEALDMYS